MRRTKISIGTKRNREHLDLQLASISPKPSAFGSSSHCSPFSPNPLPLVLHSLSNSLSSSLVFAACCPFFSVCLVRVLKNVRAGIPIRILRAVCTRSAEKHHEPRLCLFFPFEKRLYFSRRGIFRFEKRLDTSRVVRVQILTRGLNFPFSFLRLTVLQASVFRSDRGSGRACVGDRDAGDLAAKGNGDNNGVQVGVVVADVEVAGGAQRWQQRMVAVDD
ncbi:hypothetical protein E2542_SST23750 [Spatholobus suberectus]|nr:hypothetical protein E2542_SST23750 [Spatholobus suberectus]